MKTVDTHHKNHSSLSTVVKDYTLRLSVDKRYHEIHVAVFLLARNVFVIPELAKV